jgi:predicted permease
MIKKVRQFLLIALASASLLAPALSVAVAGTASADIRQSVCRGVNNAAEGNNSSSCGSEGTGGTTDLSDIAAKIVNIFSIIVGIVAVIMIIYGGFRYITSGGDSNRVGSAKNTLIYAIIGLIIVALAQIIVRYVLNTTADATNSL